MSEKFEGGCVLERAKIVVLGKPNAGKSHGKTNVAKASKASAARSLSGPTPRTSSTARSAGSSSITN
jgi:hypothetical protein